MLRLKDDVTEVKVDSISNKPFEAKTPNLNAIYATKSNNWSTINRKTLCH